MSSRGKPYHREEGEPNEADFRNGISMGRGGGPEPFAGSRNLGAGGPRTFARSQSWPMVQRQPASPDRLDGNGHGNVAANLLYSLSLAFPA